MLSFQDLIRPWLWILDKQSADSAAKEGNLQSGYSVIMTIFGGGGEGSGYQQTLLRGSGSCQLQELLFLLCPGHLCPSQYIFPKELKLLLRSSF